MTLVLFRVECFTGIVIRYTCIQAGIIVRVSMIMC